MPAKADPPSLPPCLAACLLWCVQVLVDSGVIEHLFYFEPSGNHSYLTSFTDPATGQVSYTLPGLTAEESLGVWRGIVATLCNPGHIGDMFQATSTNDITFWLLHPLQVSSSSAG